MKYGKGPLIGALIVLYSVIFVSALTAETPAAKNYPAADAKARVCILAYDTEFKRDLTAVLARDLNASGISVIADNVKNHRSYRATDYDAVIVLSGMRMGSVMSEAADFIKANDYAPNIIYVFTHKAEGSPYGKNGKVLDSKWIDAISTASVTDADTEAVALEKEIIARVTTVIAAARKS